MESFQYYPAHGRKANPVCSICIANYNGFSIIGGCIDSATAQYGDFDVEIIIHDDASTDNSVALLRAQYPQVEVLVSTDNVGFCTANNRMAEHARGKYLLLLNNDAALHPDALRALLDAAQQQLRPALLTLPEYDWGTGKLVDRGYFLDLFYNTVPNSDPACRDVATIAGSCLFTSRDFWNELNGFPEWMESLAEDLYLCSNARLRGVPVQVVPSSGYRHRQGASFGGNRVDEGKLNTTYRRRALSERNKTAVLIICTPTVLVWPLLGVHLAMLVIEGATISVLRRDTRVWREIYWQTLKATFGGMATLRARRRHQQAQRRVSLREYMRPFTFLPQKLRLLARHGVPTIR